MLDSKITDIDVWLKQRALMKRTCIHEHLLRVYGEAAVNVSTVWWWVRRIKVAEMQRKNTV
jgi:hypothetical protein